MLDEWLRQIQPPPSWNNLAEAVEQFSPQLADTITTKYL